MKRELKFELERRLCEEKCNVQWQIFEDFLRVIFVDSGFRKGRGGGGGGVSKTSIGACWVGVS